MALELINVVQLYSSYKIIYIGSAVINKKDQI